MQKGSSLHFSSGDEVFEDGLQMSEEDGGVALGEEQAGAESHGRLSARARIHTCNNTANVSVQYTAIHTCNNTANVSVQYTFTPATTQSTSVSSEHPHLHQQSQHQRPAHKAETIKPTSKTGTRLHVQQQSQHRCQVHINTYNNKANINVDYTLTPTTTKPTSMSITY